MNSLYKIVQTKVRVEEVVKKKSENLMDVANILGIWKALDVVLFQVIN